MTAQGLIRMGQPAFHAIATADSPACNQDIRWILDPEIAGGIPANAVPLPKQRLDLAFLLRHGGRIRYLDRDEIQCFAGPAAHGAEHAAFRSRRVKARLRKVKGGMSGGTAASARATLAAAAVN